MVKPPEEFIAKLVAERLEGISDAKFYASVHVTDELRGLAAVDFCRRNGLPFRVSRVRPFNTEASHYEVGELFARHFPGEYQNTNNAHFSVPMHLLGPHDFNVMRTSEDASETAVAFVASEQRLLELLDEHGVLVDGAAPHPADDDDVPF